MHSKLHTFFVLLVGLIIVQACQRDFYGDSKAVFSTDKLSVVSSGKDADTLVVTANRSWTAVLNGVLDSTEPDWLSIAPSSVMNVSGTSQVDTLFIHFDPCEPGTKRFCEIVFHAEGGIFSLPVKQ